MMTQGRPIHQNRGNALAAAGVVAGVFLVVAVGVITSGVMPGRFAEDEINYHGPVIERFARELPRPDVGNYLSATTPGYHLVLAAAARLGAGERWLRVMGAGWTAVLLGALAWACARRCGAALGVVLALPMAASVYVFPAGVWLLPDNAGWLGVLVVMLLALEGWERGGGEGVAAGDSARRRSVAWYVACGLVLAGLVLVRQVHIWAAAVVWAGAWVGAGGATAPLKSRLSLRRLRESRGTGVRERFGAVVAAIMATLPAFAVLGWFVWTWGGLVPPRFQGQYRGVNPAAPAFVLSLVGVYGVWYVGYWWRGLVVLAREGRGWLAGAAAAGAVLAAVPATTYDVEAGRFSGLWNVVETAPVIAGHTSPVILLGAIVGAVVAAGVGRSLGMRDRVVMLTALAAFAAAQAASFQVFQRYSEPMVLMMLGLAAARALQGGEKVERAARLVGPGVLATGLGVVTAVLIATSEPAVRSEALPGVSEGVVRP